jgi:lipopolysaccharide export system permease protein
VNLLNRYVTTAFARIFFLSLSTFAGIYLLVDFFEKVDNFMEHQARVSQYLQYFLIKIPLIVSQVIPLAILMGVFMTLGGLSRTNELTAMRSGGISLWRVTMPLLVISLLISAGVLAANEYLIPLCAKKSNHILEIEVKGKSPMALKRDHLWLREGDRILNIRLALPEQQALQGVTIFQITDAFSLLARTDSPRASFAEGEWILKNPIVRRFNPESSELAGLERLQEKTIELEKIPSDFRAPERSNEEMGFRELRNLSGKLRSEGYDATRHRVDMHARLASPFACLIMAFLGIPFALKKGRGANLSVGVAISVGIGIAYHILHAILTAFGYSAVLPPLVAAWSANVLFGLLGIWLMLSARD